jgi:putative glutamine amidotransferase
MRPAIGITTGNDEQRPEFHALREDYVRSVEQAGGLALVLPPGRPETAVELLDRLDGVLLSGGGDVDPALYGHAPHPRLGRVERRRDEFELALVREALRRDRPLLAICRGHQVLNVATGGTLIQDIPSETTGGVEHDPRRERGERVHRVEVVEGSRLHALLGQVNVAVNSFHHQSIDGVGDGLVVSARSEGDGLIEGVEHPGRRFVVGVQWHPESFWREQDGFRSLFAALVEASGR